MSSESVSDMRLEELIRFHDNLVGGEDDIYRVLTELKSLRAQQAEPPAGCAEMAREIYKVIAREFIDSGTYQWEEHHLEAEITDRLNATRSPPIIAAKLAPLFDKISMLESALVETEARCTEFNATIHELLDKEGK